MPKITISKDVYLRISEFKRVIETVIGNEISIDTCAEVILIQGVDLMLTQLLGPQDHGTLLSSLLQLGQKYPTQVYQYITEILQKGVAVQEREKMKDQIGFRPPISENSEE